MGKMLLVIIDTHSKWLEVYNNECHYFCCHNRGTKRCLFQIWATKNDCFGQWNIFTSEEFQQFLKANGIRHARSAPYHPETNGLEERVVQTVKEGLRKTVEGLLHHKLSRFLFIIAYLHTQLQGCHPQNY